MIKYYQLPSCMSLCTHAYLPISGQDAAGQHTAQSHKADPPRPQQFSIIQ